MSFKISREANIVGPGQTAPTGAVWSESTLFIFEASNSLVDDKKNIHFVIMRLGLIHVSSVCMRLGFSWNARTFVRLKKLINSSPNYK